MEVQGVNYDQSISYCGTLLFLASCATRQDAPGDSASQVLNHRAKKETLR